MSGSDSIDRFEAITRIAATIRTWQNFPGDLFVHGESVRLEVRHLLTKHLLPAMRSIQESGTDGNWSKWWHEIEAQSANMPETGITEDLWSTVKRVADEAAARIAGEKEIRAAIGKTRKTRDDRVDAERANAAPIPVADADPGKIAVNGTRTRITKYRLVAPRSIVRLGKTKLALSPQEFKIMEIVKQRQAVPMTDLMHRNAGALWKGIYSPARKRSIQRAINRLNDKFATARMGIYCSISGDQVTFAYE